MPDLTVSALVTRTLLSLTSLDINDYENYILADQIMGGTVSYQREQASSPWVDGEITVSRRRGNVTEPFRVWVIGSSASDLNSNVGTLITAFQQDLFTLQITVGGTAYAWQCEASDYSMDFTNVNLKALKVMVTFNLMRSPILLAGGF